MTISEFRRLDEVTQLDVLDFMEDFLVYETLTERREKLFTGTWRTRKFFTGERHRRLFSA